MISSETCTRLLHIQSKCSGMMLSNTRSFPDKMFHKICNIVFHLQQHQWIHLLYTLAFLQLIGWCTWNSTEWTVCFEAEGSVKEDSETGMQKKFRHPSPSSDWCLTVTPLLIINTLLFFQRIHHQNRQEFWNYTSFP